MCEKKRVVYYLPKRTVATLKETARGERRKMSEVVNRALQEYFTNNKINDKK